MACYIHTRIKMMKYIIICVLALGFAFSCTNNVETNANQAGLQSTLVVNKQAQMSPFSDFWDQGKAEITTYTLKQARYGEIHEGISNTIFVTEPFSKSKQVKLDNPGGNPSDNIPVMKLNFTRKFYTGVYPYSTMLSVFTPQNLKKNPHSLKAVFGAQEWCGQTYSQVNLGKGGFEMEQFSYFESEGDKAIKLGTAVLEDELWNMIRINPSSLPLGKIEMIPGLTFSRLAHYEATPVMAEAKLSSNGDMSTYTVHYPNYDRTISIDFKTAFPHQIESWQEDGYSGFGSQRKKLTTTATFKARKMLDYWSKHGLNDSSLRAELGLSGLFE